MRGQNDDVGEVVVQAAVTDHASYPTISRPASAHTANSELASAREIACVSRGFQPDRRDETAVLVHRQITLHELDCGHRHFLRQRQCGGSPLT